MCKKILTVLLVLAIYFVPSANAGIYGESVVSEDLQDQRTFSLDPDYSPGQSEGGERLLAVFVFNFMGYYL